MSRLQNIVLSLILLCTVVSTPASAFAEVLPLNHGWKFHKGFQAPDHEITDICLPHTWNREDALYGNKEYFRGLGTYIHQLPGDLKKGDNRIFLKVNAAQSVADVFVDNHFIDKHSGGYTAFVTELTDYLTPGKESRLEIRVNNAPTFDIAPICGDFNIYGGLTRGAELIVTGPVSIAHDYYASDGVFFSQKNVTKDRAELEVRTIISASNPSLTTGCKIEVSISDGEKLICNNSTTIDSGVKEIKLPLTVEKPILWNGKENPFMYTGKVILSKDGKEIDRREIPVGLRYFDADSRNGFRLNGHPLRLNGVNRHEDTAERASALSIENHSEDISLINEMGCNAVRMSHYPQSKDFVEMMDRNGLLAWIEIPFVNVHVNNPIYQDNLKQQLTEMIMQYYNHPSIVSWGLFNEINSGWLDRPSQMVLTLDSLAHNLDPTRLTMGASNQNDDFNGFTDLIAFNKYFGWYDGDPSQMGEWLDNEHKTHPERIIGISEYGAGASVMHQCDTLERPMPWGRWHPENWQTYYHIETYRELSQRDYLWCNFIWCMFDFCAASRNEGDTPGRNDKGLVTYDRKTKKDAFYFYKANWNKSKPFIHIANKRAPHTSNHVDITAFSNDGDAELRLNGKVVCKASPDDIKILLWKDVPLIHGDNIIEVRTRNASDSFIITK